MNWKQKNLFAQRAGLKIYGVPLTIFMTTAAGSVRVSDFFNPGIGSESNRIGFN